jgi:hypothetical protein
MPCVKVSVLNGFHNPDPKIIFLLMYFLQSDVRLEIFTAKKFQVTVFWVMTPRSDILGHQNSSGAILPPYSW